MTPLLVAGAITGLLFAVGARFYGTFSGEPEFRDTSFIFGLLGFAITLLVSLCLVPLHLGWGMVLIGPIAAVLAIVLIGLALFAGFKICAWVGRGIDNLAVRARELRDDYNFHRDVDRGEH